MWGDAPEDEGVVQLWRCRGGDGRTFGGNRAQRSGGEGEHGDESEVTLYEMCSIDQIGLFV
jgi:hypothetical protein